MKYVSAAEFKAKCLKLMDEVGAGGEPITVTKRGKPVAVMSAPAPAPERKPLFGCMKGTVTVHDDIVGPIDPDWEAAWEAKWDRLGFPVLKDAPES